MGVVGNISYKCEAIDSGYNEEVCFMGGHVLGSRLTFQRPPRNQGHDIEGWKGGIWVNQNLEVAKEKRLRECTIFHLNIYRRSMSHL